MAVQYYSYVVVRDFGFAPNPFYNCCTLATCKPRIRKSAKVGDWIFGITSKRIGNRLLYAMCINHKISFNEYWNHPNYQCKKPIMNGSLKQMYGDNIYSYDEVKNEWNQVNSHHSLDDGKINYDNLKMDTGGKFVLISEDYFYFGINHIEMPKDIKDKVTVLRNHKIIENDCGIKFVKWLKNNYKYGYYGNPINFNKFQRYNGK